MFKKLRDFIKVIANDDCSILKNNSEFNNDLLQGRIIERAIPELKNKIPIVTKSLHGDGHSEKEKKITLKQKYSEYV